MRTILAAAFCLTAFFPHAGSAADWQPVEQEAPYTVTGRTGLELYESIGARGPKAGDGRAIAHTSFKLTWRRDYQRQGNACVLASAKPKLIITYTLPKVSGKLASPLKESWETFIEGVRTHERVHGRMIIDMVREIEAFSVGLRQENDPNCRKIRETLTRRLAEISQAQRQKSRDFDRVELSKGGNVHTLVLNLVNGP